MYICKICNKPFERASQVGGHTYYCRAKRDGVNLRPGDRFAKGRGWQKGLTKQTSASIKLKSEKLSDSMKVRMAKNGVNDQFISWMKDPVKFKAATEKRIKSLKMSYATGKIVPAKGSGWGKSGWYKGIWCDSSWELAWVIYNLDHNILFKRNDKRYSYNFENEQHVYIPDFELIDGTLVEIKGHFTDKTKAKIASVNTKLIVLTRNDIQPFLKYVRGKYGENFINLYDNYEKEKLFDIDSTNLKDNELVRLLIEKWKLKEQKVFKIIKQFRPELISNYKSKLQRRKQMILDKQKAKQEQINLIKQQQRQSKEKLINELISKVLQANIDYSSFGWVNEVAKLLDKRPQKINHWMKKYMSDFYVKNCFKRECC
jgi:hypothetical protein